MKKKENTAPYSRKNVAAATRLNPGMLGSKVAGTSTAPVLDTKEVSGAPCLLSPWGDAIAGAELDTSNGRGNTNGSGDACGDAGDEDAAAGAAAVGCRTGEGNIKRGSSCGSSCAGKAECGKGAGRVAGVTGAGVGVVVAATKSSSMSKAGGRRPSRGDRGCRLSKPEPVVRKGVTSMVAAAVVVAAKAVSTVGAGTSRGVNSSGGGDGVVVTAAMVGR